MPVTPLTFPAFVDTTDSEQRWQIFSAIQGQTGLAENVTVTNNSGNPIPVTISGSTGATNYELVVSTYTCKTAFTGASVGDIITETQIIAITGGVASTLQTIWRNQTTATDLSSAPSSVNLSLNGTTALTQAQLQAMTVANLKGKSSKLTWAPPDQVPQNTVPLVASQTSSSSIEETPAPTSSRSHRQAVNGNTLAA